MIGEITWPNDEENIINNVGRYAKENMVEFVAEYIAGKMNGREYPKDIDALYQKWGGPQLFK